MARAGACVSTMAKPCFPVTAPSQSATLVHNQYACAEDAGYLAGLAYGRIGWLLSPSMELGEYYFCTQKKRSHMPNSHCVSVKFADRFIPAHYAGTIPGINLS
jgi:hypothetical protein